LIKKLRYVKCNRKQAKLFTEMAIDLKLNADLLFSALK